MRKMFLVVVAATVILCAFSAAARAAGGYPAKPIEILCPYTPGSSMDIMARLIADVGAKYVSQPLVVVNKPGAGGSLAAAEIVSAKPDKTEQQVLGLKAN